LSYSQQRLWLLHQFEPDNPAFNFPSRLTLKEPLEIKTVQRALETLVQRHDAFRTYFKKVQGQPVQVILPHLDFHLDHIDLSKPGGEESRTARDQLFYKESATPFGLETPPLFRAKAIKAGDREFDVFLTMHHMVTDGWSMEVLMREFRLLYQEFRGDRKETLQTLLEPLSIQYKDFACWHNRLLEDKEQMESPMAFWRDQLSRELPVLDLPCDYSKTDLDTKESAGYRIVVPLEVSRGLKQVAAQCNASIFMVLLAAFNMLMTRLSGQNNILLGVPGAARPHNDLKNVVGLFVNTLILTNPVNPDETFDTLLEQVQTNMFQVMDHQSVPLELICKELRIRYPEISVFFNMFTLGNALDNDLENTRGYHMENVQKGKFDIECYLGEYRNGIEIITIYYKELFKPFTIERIMQLYLVILENISNDPGKPLRDYYKSAKRRKLKLN
ncbi:MAG: hypothetical protein GY940_14370, partial [bacterium]|nr:hypothetical protein [bacterium]